MEDRTRPLEYPFLDLVSSPSEPHKLDIVFVHGLNAFGRSHHPFETWEHTRGGPFWPRDFLGQDISSARIFIYGYNSNVNSREPVSVDRITDHANNLLLLLDSERNSNDYYQSKIIFIGHSLGGLVIKQALLNAMDNRAYSSIQNATFGLVFFACPHHGAKGVELGMLAMKLIRILSKGGASNELLESLRHNSLFTKQMSERFQQRLEDYKVVSFTETLPLRLGSSGITSADTIIVERESSILGLPGSRETQVSLGADHSSICKFGSKGGLYRIVYTQINKIASQAIATAEAYIPPPPVRPTPSPRPPSNYPDANTPGSNPLYGDPYGLQPQASTTVHGALFQPKRSDAVSQQLADHKNRGRWEQAKKLAYDQFNEKRRINPNSAETLEAAYEIAFAYLELRLPKDAGEWAHWVANECKRALGADHALLMRAENIIARVMIYHGQFSEAEALASNVFLRQRDLLSADHIDTIETQATLAAACSRLGRQQEAMERLEKGVESLKRIFGEKHIRTYAGVIEMLEVAFPNDMRPFCYLPVSQKAKAMIEVILKEIKEVHGPFHPMAIHALRVLGMWKSNEGKFTDAIDDLRSAHSAAERVWDRNHPETMLCVAFIGCCYYKQQQDDQASPWLRTYLDFISSRTGDKNPEAIAVLRLIAHPSGYGQLTRDKTQALQDLERLSLAYGDENSPEAHQTREMAKVMQLRTAFTGTLSRWL